MELREAEIPPAITKTAGKANKQIDDLRIITAIMKKEKGIQKDGRNNIQS